jgi:hypothetical protein
MSERRRWDDLTSARPVANVNHEDVLEFAEEVYGDKESSDALAMMAAIVISTYKTGLDIAHLMRYMQFADLVRQDKSVAVSLKEAMEEKT